MAQAAYVYILANHRRGTLYSGVTSDLARRLHEHRHAVFQGFTSRYSVARLVWYVHGDDIASAIALEKKIKNRGRQWKIELIEKDNPRWEDLADRWMNSGSCDCAQDDSQSNSDDRPGRSDDEAGNVVPHAVAKSTDGTLDESATCPHVDKQPDRTRQPA